MKIQFKHYNGKVIEDFLSYSKSYIQSKSNIKTYVGTDSQVKGGNIIYVSCIAFHDVGNGAHIIYSKDKVKRRYVNLHDRLLKEVERTVFVANELRNVNINAITHFDINPDDAHKSYIVYRAASGWATGAGFKFIAKPNSWAASCAADSLCK